MSEQTPKKRPTLPERHKELMSFSEINELITILEIAYEETRNEKVFKALSKLKTKIVTARAEFFDREELYREMEMEEFYRNIGNFPHSVRTWLLYYKDK